MYELAVVSTSTGLITQMSFQEAILRTLASLVLFGLALFAARYSIPYKEGESR